MKTLKNLGAQGDLMIIRVSDVPSDAVEVKPTGGHHVVAHSETGHHHTIAAANATVLRQPGDIMRQWLRVTGHSVQLKHHRPHDTHETLRIPRGTYELRRQREYTPQGWRRVED